MTSRLVRKLGQLAQAVRTLPSTFTPTPVDSITIVTGANSSHFKSLCQFLRSARTHEPDTRTICFDLGLEPDEVVRLHEGFPEIEHRRFDYSQWPPHVDIRNNAGQYAWKPIIVAELLRELDSPVVWMDAGNMITRRLVRLRRVLRATNFYSPHSKGSLRQWTHPLSLEALDCPATLLERQNLNGACVAFDPSASSARKLADDWFHASLKPSHISPPGSDRTNHRQDQAVLSVLAYKSGLGFRTFPFSLDFRIHCDVD